MAKPNTYSDQKDVPQGARRRWWFEPEETVARELSNYCRSLEDGQQRERYLGMVFEQLATGRAPTSYGIQMDGRVKGDLATALFSAPSENFVRLAVDVFANKIGKNRPFLQWSTTAMYDTDLRDACEQATDYCEQIFEDLKTWPMVEASFKHGVIHGNGPILVDGEEAKDGRPGRVTLTQLFKDEILLDPTAGENPPNFQVRLFQHRDEVIRKYANGKDKEQKDLKDKLSNTPGCKQGFFNLDVGYDDILALCIGYYIPGDGSPGRKVVAINDLLLEDAEFTGDLPIASYVFEPIAGSWAGQGCPEMQLPLQREVDRIADNLAEQERRFCWAKWGYRRDDQVDPDALIGNASVEYNEQPPKALDAPEPSEFLYQQLEKKGNQCLAQVGISLNQSQGMSEPGINAGVAIIASAQIDDVRHVGPSQRLENHVENIGKLIIQAAGRFNPPVYSNGKKISWPKIVDDQTKCKCRAFKMSGLPQSIPGRRQELWNMFQQGEIDKKTYRRAIHANEIRQTEDLITVVDDFVNWQLDNMMKKGAEFDPPPPFIDFPRALELSQKRLMIETKNGVEEDRLQFVAQYMAMCAQRVDELQSATPNPSEATNPAETPSPAGAQPAPQG